MTITWTPVNKPPIMYTSTKDNKTYTARQLTASENGKEITGVYVYDAKAKPDKNGNINGEFMSMDTFKKKLTDELPAVNASLVQAYNPNIKVSSPEEKFDCALSCGVQLSDGSTLLQPYMMNTGHTEIKNNNDGTYDVVFTSFVGGYKHEPVTRTLSEEDLIADKGLCGGLIKKLDDNSYEVTYYTSSNFKDTEMNTEVMDKNSCIDFMTGHGLHI